MKEPAESSSHFDVLSSPLSPMTEREFDEIRALVYDRFGINLTEQKRSLVVSRLQKLIRTLGLQSYGEYLSFVRSDRSGQAVVELVNHISTNHTFFNRENDHFEYFMKHALPARIQALRQQNRRDLRVWCAGCSSGEEAYTLVMCMMECLGAEYSSWNAGLLATDISAKVLQTAQAGLYTAEKTEQLPSALLAKYFKNLDNGWCEVVERLKKEITFRRFNLMNETFPFKQPFDVVFCRNVMIYFDRETTEALVERFYRFTQPGGYLFIGHSESLRGRSLYQYVQPGVYRRPA